MGERARQVFDQQAGATARCVEALKELLLPARLRSSPHEQAFFAAQAAAAAGSAYRLALALRELRLGTKLEPVRRLRWPVVSIGNLSTGGAGKTPLTIALAKALDSRGLRVDVLSRGYGRRSQLAARVNPDGTAPRNSATSRC